MTEKTWISVSASIGAAALPGHGRTAAELVLVADRALYAAKRTGRNRLLIGEVDGEQQEVAAASGDIVEIPGEPAEFAESRPDRVPASGRP